MRPRELSGDGAVRSNRGDRVRLDLSELRDLLTADDSAETHLAHATMLRHDGRLGTVLKGDDRRLWTCFRFVGRVPHAITVAWDNNEGDALLPALTFRDQLQQVHGTEHDEQG